jgi:mannose-6-phosphate isomerase-like protein (cupin superfamily)
VALSKGEINEDQNRKRRMNWVMTRGQRDRIAKRVFVVAGLVVLSLAGIGCGHAVKAKQAELPKKSYERQPEQPFSSLDYVFKPNQLTSFYDVPGEFGHAMEGATYGFKSLSFIITETQPGGGPPLHVHDCEEAHVLLEGTATYVLGDRKFTVEGPYVVKIPTGVPPPSSMPVTSPCA